MKATEREKPIHTVPKGVWESSTPYEKNQVSQKEHLKQISTDAQGNAYPTNALEQEKETSWKH